MARKEAMRQVILASITGVFTYIGSLGQALGAELRDPTQPILNVGFSAEESAENLIVQGVLISPMGSSALINDKWVKVGASINGARVISINRGRVVLLMGGNKKTLYLFGKIWKKLQ